jgi:hypothetical protein
MKSLAAVLFDASVFVSSANATVHLLVVGGVVPAVKVASGV